MNDKTPNYGQPAPGPRPGQPMPPRPGQPVPPDPHQQEKEKKKRRRRRKRRVLTLIILLLIILGAVLFFLFGDKLGLGEGLGFLYGTENEEQAEAPGGDEGGNQQIQEDISGTPEPSPTEAEQGTPAAAFITVKEGKILLNDTELTLDGLKLQLEGPYNGAEITLKDDYAIKETYESVENLLKELGITNYEKQETSW